VRRLLYSSPAPPAVVAEALATVRAAAGSKIVTDALESVSAEYPPGP
jgi:hypothetical protein